MAELSGLEVLVLVREISGALKGSYLSHVYSIGGSQLLRFRRPESDDVWLVVSPKRGVWVSKLVEERAVTTEFTSRLRGELERARFRGAAQAGLDRVFDIALERDEPRRMVVELMPPGNVLVLDGSGRVVVALYEIRSKTRRVVKGEVYRPPTQGRASPASVTPLDLEGAFREEKTVGRAIGRHVALPRKYVAETLARLGLSESDAVSGLLGREEEIADAIRGLVAEAQDRPRPCICTTQDGDEVFSFPPVRLEVKESAQTVSELCDQLFLKEVESVEAEKSPEDTRKKELEATVSKLKAEAASLLSRASEARSAALEASRGSTETALRILRDASTPYSKLPVTPASISSALYDLAKSFERRSADAEESAARLEKRASKVRVEVSRRQTLLPKRKLEWYERFRWFTSSEGKLAVGGRDAQSNSLLVKRHLDDEDAVYHADLFGSPFFILKGGRRQTESEVLELAQATVSFSSGWKTGLGAADSYWVTKEQVSASAESGEYLARGSFVIRGKKNFVRHSLLQVAVGVDASGRVMAGPEQSIAKSCDSYVVLSPHREKSSDTAKKVLRELGQAEGPSPTLDEVIRALPSGGGKIVRRKSRNEPVG